MIILNLLISGSNLSIIKVFNSPRVKNSHTSFVGGINNAPTDKGSGEVQLNSAVEFPYLVISFYQHFL